MDKNFIKIRYSRIRIAHNISARKLSLELGQSSDYINQIENGKCMPSIEALINFCEYFNLSLGEFFEENFEYPVEYKKIISELNKMDALAVNQIYELLKLANSGKQ